MVREKEMIKNKEERRRYGDSNKERMGDGESEKV
jgi:hypothetical protein